MFHPNKLFFLYPLPNDLLNHIKPSQDIFINNTSIISIIFYNSTRTAVDLNNMQFFLIPHLVLHLV